MTNRQVIEHAVISSILQGGDKVLDLCSEFGITSQHFEDKKLGLCYALIEYGHPHAKYQYVREGIADFVPDSTNARYYIEELVGLNEGRSLTD